jgi:trimeric autotransporter adhesin
MRIFTRPPKYFYFLLPAILGLVFLINKNFSTALPEKTTLKKEALENEEQDEMDKAMAFQVERIKDISLGYVPTERLLVAKEVMEKKFAEQQNKNNDHSLFGPVSGITWAERGPNDIGGRSRAVAFDLNGAPGYTKVWAGGVGGGLWVTNDITAASPVWTKQNDLFDNIAVTSFAQSSSNTQDMYFGTGEGWFNLDGIRGLGIWYSGNGGTSWAQLASTNNSNFHYIQKIVVDATGNVYACTKSGLRKSTDKGVSWNQVLGTATLNVISTPTNIAAINNDAADIEIAANGDLYCSVGIFSTGAIYRSTNGGTTWTNITPALSGRRIELAAAPSNANIVYALFHSNVNNNCSAIQKYDASVPGWTAGTVPTIIDQGSNSNFTRGQAWYDLIAAVDPNNANSLYIGGVDALRSDNGGVTWDQKSTWALFGATPRFSNAQNVHADQHGIVYQPGSSSKALWATDGGIYYTTDANVVNPAPPGTPGTPVYPTWVSKNNGFNVTQYYSVAIHPTLTNYLSGGTQDNGTHTINAAGISSGTTVTGGDGAFSHIDQENGSIQISAYTGNNFNITTNAWTNFSSYSFPGGSFISPTDYDDVGKFLYGGSVGGSFFRWASPATRGVFQTFTIPAFPTAIVTHVTVSPITNNRVYFGLDNGAVVRIDNANTTPVATTIKASGSPSASVSCIAIDPSNENHALITYSNFGSNSVLESTNALAATPTWTNDRGNLPDMPVYWAMFDPRNSDWAILATDMGVWSTDNLNAATTNWGPTNTGFANVRVDMLQYRASDRLLAAGTHGRGIFTTNIPASTTPGIKFEKALASKTELTSATIDCRPYTDYTVNVLIENAPVGDALVTLNVAAGNTATPGLDFDFTTNGDFAAPSNVLAFLNGTNTPKTVTIRVYNDALVESTENFTLEYAISGATNATRAVGPQTYSFEIKDNDRTLVAPGTANNYAIGTNNLGSGNGLGNASPFRSNEQKHRVQQLYSAAELIAAGATAGDITEMTIRVVTKNSTRPYKGFTISIANTTATSMNAGFVSGSFVQVYTGDYTSAVGNNVFTFGTGTGSASVFTWDGTSNIAVQYCFDNAPDPVDALPDFMEGNSAPLGVRSSSYSNHTAQTTAGCVLPVAFVDYSRINAVFRISLVGNAIETTLNATKTENVNTNSNVYMYSSGNSNIISSISNASANLGCVAAQVFEAGNTWQSFSGGQRSQKVIDITPTTNAGTSYNVSLYFTAAELAGKAPATLKIAKTTAATIAGANSGNTVIANTSFSAFGSGYVFTASFTGFSKFFLTDNNVALPVTLLSFDGYLTADKTTALNWSTAEEYNSKEFEIERSYDGNTFVSIGSVLSQGNIAVETKYRFNDNTISQEFNYYRLKMIDKDGKFTYSKVVLIKNPRVGKGKFKVLNNPFNQAIDIQLETQLNGNAIIRLFDMSGKTIYLSQAAINNQTRHRINLGNTRIAAGTYLLEVSINGKRFIEKVLKQ